MRRLISGVLAGLVLLAAPSCKRRDTSKMETVGDTASSGLATIVHVADPKTAAQLVKGFHEVEHGTWRWTAGQFAVALRPPRGAAQNGATLQLKISVAEAVLAQLKSQKLSAAIGGTVLAPASYDKPGEYTYSCDVPASALKGDSVTVEFSLDRFLAAGAVDTRELGTIVTSVGFEPK